MISIDRNGWKRMVFAVALAAAGSTSHAQSVVNGPYYAAPSWDQTMPASTRFLVLSNFNGDAVLDRETGLVWQRTPLLATTSYVGAFFNCGNLRTGGRFGWRLPAIAELTSLFDPNAMSAPALPTGHPFVGLSTSGIDGFWSSTAGSIGTTPARFVWFTGLSGSSIVGNIAQSPENNPHSTWCVRASGDGGATR